LQTEDPLRSETRYWFTAKRYGWGWGFPIAWQGWLVFAAFVLLLVVGAYLFPRKRRLPDI